MGIPKAGWWSSPKPEDSAASRELATEASAARGSRIQQATGSSPTSRGRPPQPDPRRVGSSGLAEVSEPGAPAPTTNRDRRAAVRVQLRPAVRALPPRARGRSGSASRRAPLLSQVQGRLEPRRSTWPSLITTPRHGEEARAGLEAMFEQVDGGRHHVGIAGRHLHVPKRKYWPQTSARPTYVEVVRACGQDASLSTPRFEIASKRDLRTALSRPRGSQRPFEPSG